jgi:predicted secreted hydrolase
VLVAVAGVGARDAAQGWAPAQRGYRLSLPRDHGAHPQHKIEWWYYTGNVEGAGGQRYGYQLTFFRVGVHPQPANPSRWAVRDLYMAHFAITDVGGRRYRASDRLNRAGVGWAGASSGTLEVWNEDWSARLSPDGSHVLRARDGDMAIDLVLAPGKPFVAHGDAGYSQKGSTEGNASHYYSLTRMPTRGTVTVNGRSVTVQGESWMDHEFGSSFLEAGQQGWDWFSIHLDDRTDLMLFQIRRADGSRDPRSSGTIVDARGGSRHLTAADFTLTPTGAKYTGPSGATYPVGWTIAVPASRSRSPSTRRSRRRNWRRQVRASRTGKAWCA